jgi:hypothetical protein
MDFFLAHNLLIVLPNNHFHLRLQRFRYSLDLDILELPD